MYQGVIMSGFGGQGIVSGGILLAYSGMVDGKHVTFFPAYGSFPWPHPPSLADGHRQALHGPHERSPFR